MNTSLRINHNLLPRTVICPIKVKLVWKSKGARVLNLWKPFWTKSGSARTDFTDVYMSPAACGMRKQTPAFWNSCPAHDGQILLIAHENVHRERITSRGSYARSSKHIIMDGGQLAAAERYLRPWWLVQRYAGLSSSAAAAVLTSV